MAEAQFPFAPPGRGAEPQKPRPNAENPEIPVDIAQLKPASFALYCEFEKQMLRDFPAPENRLFLLAVSGGADSTALAVLARLFSKRKNFRLAAIHVNHHLREAADADEAFVGKLCAALDIDLISASLDVEAYAKSRKMGLEEAGHWGRREILTGLLEKTGALKVLTGHHLRDQAEEILMRFIRGSGWPALGGMGRTSGIFHRPLLGIDPERLRRFLIDEDIPWVEDASNQSRAFRRNRVRHALLPLLQTENPGFLKSVARINALARTDRAYWEAETGAFFTAFAGEDKTGGAIFLPGPELRKLHPALRLRVFMEALRRAGRKDSAPVQARADGMFILEEAFLAKKSGKRIQFPGRISALIKKDGVLFCREEDQD